MRLTVATTIDHSISDLGFSATTVGRSVMIRGTLSNIFQTLEKETIFPKISTENLNKNLAPKVFFLNKYFWVQKDWNNQVNRDFSKALWA